MRQALELRECVPGLFERHRRQLLSFVRPPRPLTAFRADYVVLISTYVVKHALGRTGIHEQCALPWCHVDRACPAATGLIVPPEAVLCDVKFLARRCSEQPQDNVLM